ncbi:MAG TPA: hypothetical protein VJY65_13700 [Chloroflexota bacterium]|nr:hypothetical protein [Chloroflexota bacterium]
MGKPNPKALVKKYNALKKTKGRTKGSAAKKEVQKAIDQVVDELNAAGLNTRGKPTKPQGYGAGTHCICSPAEQMMGRHRPNCPSS